MMKRKKQDIEYTFINLNTPEETRELLKKKIVDKLLREKYPFAPEQRIAFDNEDEINR